MPKVFLMLFLLLIAYSAEGQLSISGSVKNKEGEALTGATVSFKDSFKGTVTGANGKFIFTNLSSRQYTILVSYVGYSVVSKNIFLEKNMDIDIILEKSPYGLEEVVVKSSRAGLKDPVAMHMIDKEEITSRNLGQDIPSLLSHSPSLVSSSDAGHGIGYSGFRIRGTDANRINITIDGIPLNDAESHGVWWVNLPDFASSVEDIQIQRGVGTSTNGSAAFGASVNLKTAALSSEPYAESDNSFGSFSTWKTSNRVGTGLMENGFSFDFRYSMIGTDGFIDRAESSLNSMFITAGYYSEKNILKFNLISGTEKTYQAWDGVPSYILPTNRSYNGIGAYTNAAGMEMYYDNETDNYSQDHLQLHYTRELTEGMWLNASLHYTLGEGYYEQYKSDEKFNDYGIPDLILGTDTISSTDLIRQKWLDNDFYGTVLSLNYQRNSLEAKIGYSFNIYDGDHFGEVIWAQYSAHFDKSRRWYESNGLKYDHNAFAKANYQVNKKLSLYSDFQIRKIDYTIDGFDDDLRDISQDHDFLFFNPKFGFNYNFSDNSRAYFSFGVANREPNRSNFVDADPNLPPPVYETLYDYELGYSVGTEKLRADFNYYFMDYDNQLVLTGEINDVGAAIMTNVKDSYRTGIEIAVGLKPADKIDWEFNLALSRNRILNMTSLVDNWDYWDDPGTQPYQYESFYEETELAFSPSIVASSVFSYEPIDRLVLKLQSKYVGKQYIDNTASEKRKLNPWFVNDIIINYNIKTSFADNFYLNFMVINVLNEEYESNAWVYRYVAGGEEGVYDGYFPQAGIHFMSGIGIRF